MTWCARGKTARFNSGAPAQDRQSPADYRNGRSMDFGPADCPVDRMALFLDVDGTLIEFAPRPDAVRVPPDLPDALASAERRLGGALALLSGRAIADLDRLMAPLRLRTVGLHGAEWRAAPDAPTTATVPLPLPLVAAARALLPAFPGTWLEDKGPSFAVHYRASPELGVELGAALARFAQRAAEDGANPRLELMAGELVYEIKPAGFDKGSALSRFMQLPPFVGRRPVFVTDHVIDQAGMQAALDLGGYALSVGQKLPGAVAWFRNPASVRAWLKGLA
jgi:trehalose 6-phosphate phosphatase